MSTTRNIIEGIKNVTSEGVTKTQVGLSNVTNESKSTMFTNPTFTGNGITIPVLASDPSGAVPGQMYYNSTDKAIKNFDGTSWTLMTNKFTATGGTVTESGGYRIHTFTSSGTFTALSSGTVECLIVAGGGAGGTNAGGGGGAGGLIYQTAITVAPNYFSIIVGAGGSNGGSDLAPAGSGTNSLALGYTAIGGGGGINSHSKAASGGSGGGSSVLETGGDGTFGQGNKGGDGNGQDGSDRAAGGGGGAGAAGQNVQSSTMAGQGGNGLQNSISGTNIYYAGGGGGASHKGNIIRSGGLGGGGNSGLCNYPTSGTPGQHGSSNTGGGGGAGSGGGYIGGNGGSGIVIIRYSI